MIHNSKTITFSKLSQNDIPLLLEWFSKPHVQQWWPTLDENETTNHFLKRIRSQDTFGFIVNINKNPIGYIQYYYIDPKGEKTGKWLPKLPVTTIGTDQFIGDTNYLGKRYGTRMLQEFINYINSIEPTITTIIVDPDPTNKRAIRCYEKVGFVQDKVYETSYGPSLLMKYTLNANT